MVDRNRVIPLWLPNAVIFVILFLMITIYFSWQIHGVEKSFLAHVRQHADMVSKIVRLNAAGSFNARQSIEDVLKHLLGNTARFVSFLDMIEPFAEDELAAFSRESGLAGITIFRNKFSESSDALQSANRSSQNSIFAPIHSTGVHSSNHWRKQVEGMEEITRANLPTEPTLLTDTSKHLYTLLWVDDKYSGYIMLGIRNDNLAAVTERLGIENTIRTITTVPGIRYVDMVSTNNETTKGDGSEQQRGLNGFPEGQISVLSRSDRSNSKGKGKISEKEKPQSRESRAHADSQPVIIRKEGRDVAHSSQMVRGMQLNIGVDANYLNHFTQRLTLHFYLFGCFLIMAGIFLSFILYRYQKKALNQAQQYERELSSQREEASLGRSAAAIAHEIRNPLNSLSMGLQRLTLEKACDSPAHLKLIRQMSAAVTRANGSVTGLLNYAKPRIPDFNPVVPKNLLMDIMGLYQPAYRRHRIEVTTDIDFHGSIDSDGDLLGQVFENIIKNAMEAQPDGGHFHCGLHGDSNVRHPHVKHTWEGPSQAIWIQFRNGNCPVPPKEANQILEPYFTTRPEGTGLGMAIVGSIIKSLHGKIHIAVSNTKEIRIDIYLPLKN